MGILDSIKNLANQAVDTIKGAAEDAQEKASELKTDFDEAGGAKGLFDKAGDKLSELGDDISDAAGKAVDTATTKAAELKADYTEAGGAKGLFDKTAGSIKDAAKSNDDTPKA